jgi:hypothetical protein
MPEPVPVVRVGVACRVRAGVAGLVLAGLLAGCGTRPGVITHGPAPTAIPWSGPVFMLDHEGRARREPDLFDLTATSTFDGMTWQDWGEPQAVGTGWEVDYACLNGCTGENVDGYQATIVLSGLVRRRNAAYYSHASVTPSKALPDWAEDLGQVVLPLPEN